MSDVAAPSLFDRAVRRIATVWRDMAAGVSRDEDDRIPAQMRACLAGRGGEVSARNRAAKLAQAYLGLDEAGRRGFLHELAGFDSDLDAAAAAWEQVRDAPDEAERAAAKARLRRALEPPRLRLLTQFSTIPDGVRFLVELRAFLMRNAAADPHLAALESDLRGLLASWFDVGFLELRRIDWTSPAMLLERLVGYEAVHEIRGWRDLKDRLDSDRRCYGFFHPRMPDEPLIFVEVALVKGLADSVQRLLDRHAPVLDPAKADTAIFYSISNCQRGLAGISFGNFLIKRVVELLSGEYANVRHFATLSPMPGFRRWLAPRLAENAPNLLSEEESAALVAVCPGAATGTAALAAILAEPRFRRDPKVAKAVGPVLVRLGAGYLMHESRGQRALDPVAHFHLSNGARIERILMGADISEKGENESATLMVNYLYDPARIEAQHEDYAGAGRRSASTTVRRLAQRSPPVAGPEPTGGKARTGEGASR